MSRTATWSGSSRSAAAPRHSGLNRRMGFGAPSEPAPTRASTPCPSGEYATTIRPIAAAYGTRSRRRPRLDERERHLVGVDRVPQRALGLLPLGERVVAHRGPPDQPLLDERPDRLHRPAHGHERVRPVGVQQVDRADAEPPRAALDLAAGRCASVGASGVNFVAIVRLARASASSVRTRLADDVLRRPRPVALGGVDERDPERGRAMDEVGRHLVAYSCP